MSHFRRRSRTIRTRDSLYIFRDQCGKRFIRMVPLRRRAELIVGSNNVRNMPMYNSIAVHLIGRRGALIN